MPVNSAQPPRRGRNPGGGLRGCARKTAHPCPCRDDAPGTGQWQNAPVRRTVAQKP
jgi:hypothetical protein